MSRRKQATKRKIVADPLCQSVLVARLVNYVMLDGKKGVSMRIVYRAMYIAFLLESEGGKMSAKVLFRAMTWDYMSADAATIASMLKILESAIESIMSPVEVKSRRVGGANYQVPVEVRPDRRLALALRWLVQAANKRNEKTMVERLGLEIYQAIKGLGGAVKKKEETLRMAKANRVFSHYRV